MNFLRHNFTVYLRALAIGFILLTLFLLFAFYKTQNTNAVAGINRTINFQGKLVNNPAKTNVSNTTYSVVFTIYDNASGGTALWSETQSVTTADGIFRVALGSVTPIPEDFNFNWDGLYLGIKVEADSEMTPRVRLTAVPYAFNAQRVAGLTVQDTSGNASTSGTLRIPNAETINLGNNSLTFTTSTDTTLTLPASGTLSTLAGVEELTNKTIGSTGLIFSGASTDITTASNEDFTLTPNGSGNIILSGDFDSGITVGSDGGIEFPLLVRLGIGSNAALAVDQLNSGDLFSASASGVTRFTIKNDGNASSSAGFTVDGTGGIQTTNAQTLVLGGTTTGNILIQGNDLITLGKAATAGILNLGVGTGADVINIGTSNSNADILSIGNNNSGTTLSLTGGDDWSITTAGEATFTAFNGAGLSDCDSATSKLLWNDASGTFSCGTDMGSNLQVVDFTDTTTEVATFTSVMDIWDGTYANITPGSTNSEILISVNIRGTSDEANDHNPVFTIRRAIDSNPTCSSTQVGGEFVGGFLTTATQDWGATVTTSDAPSSTGNVRYTVCTTTTGLDDANTDEVRIVLTEIGTSSAGGGTGNVAVRETDSSPSVASASTIEFGPTSSSSDEFIVSDQGSGVARIRMGNQVGLLNEAESVTGGWSFNTLDTTFSSGILANGGINTSSNTNLTLDANGSGDILFDIDADSNIQFNASAVPTLDMLSISNSGFGITTDEANGIKLDFVTDAIIGARTNSALNINVTSGATELSDTLYGINLANITGQTGTEVALNIGSGWDSAIVTNGGNINLGAGYVNLSTGNLAFSGTGSITLTGGSISDVTDEVDINDDLAVAGNVSLTGVSGISLTGAGADITFANLETISNDTNGTITLGRNDSGTVILTSADDDSTAAFSILSGGASALTLDTGGAAALNIGQSNSNSIVIGNTNASTNITLTKGASGNIILNGFNCSTFTNGGTLTANSLGYIECQDDNGGGAGLTYFDSDLGAVYTNNSTYDLLIGGSSTVSAKFGFINAGGSGIPTATISATSGNSVIIDANGNITTTKKQSLILGGGDSGEVQVSSALRVNNGLFGAGLTDCDSTFSKLLWNDATGTFSCGIDTSGADGVQVDVFGTGNDGTDAWTKPSGTLYARVVVVGGGGGGGGADDAGGSAVGAGGGGGGYSEEWFDEGELATQEDVAVGSGGGGGTGAATGSTGGTSSFGTGPFLQATGGVGGEGMSGTTALQNVLGGNGGIGSNGDMNIAGQPGANGTETVNDSQISSGEGGSTPLGGGGAPVDGADSDGNPGRPYGGGGSGASDTNTSAENGGTGAEGVVIVYSYLGGSGGGGGGGGDITIRESDGSSSVSTVSILEFGPASSSEEDFVVNDEGGGTARVTVGTQIARLEDAETVTGGWTFNTASTTFSTGIFANGGINTTSNTDLSLASEGTGNIVLVSDFNSGVMIGSSGNTPAPLSVSGGIGNNAAFILDQLNSGDLFTASASGTTRFTIDNSGNIITLGSLISPVWDGLGATALTIGSNDITSLTIITDSTGDSEVVLPNQSIGASEIVNDSITSIQLSAALTFSDGDFLDLASILHNDSALQGIRLPQGGSFTNPTSGEGFLAWNTTGAGELQVYNGTSWTGVGGANFDAVYAKSVSDADVTMEINNGSGLIFDLTSSGDFTISDGGTPIAVFEDTGGLTFSPNSTGNFVINVDSNSSVGIGTNNPTATLDLRGANSSNPIATISGNTSGAGLSVDNNGTGDLLSIFKSGAEKFSIDNGGDVTIANLNASNCDVKADGTGLLYCGNEIGADGVTVDIFTSNDTWTKADYSGLNFTQVITSAGGGGGGGADGDGGNEGGGGGGGAGGTAIEIISAATLSDTETVLIDTTGGSGGVANGGGTGTSGGGASFGAHNSATGGIGGIGVNSTGTCLAADLGTGGAGGGASGGDINITGGSGGNPGSCIAEEVVGAMGGSSYWGGGGTGGEASGTTAVAGTSANAYGAGGGGAANVDNTTGAAGGNGANGIVVTMNYKSSAGDLAEWYETEEDVEYGDVVAISENSIKYDSKLGLQKSSILKKAVKGENVIGVVSSVPFETIGGDILSGAKHPKPIALAGRVPVKVTEANGKIKAGNLLTASNTPGVAQLSVKAGVVVGKALEDSNCTQDEECTVLTMVNTSYTTGALTKVALRGQGLNVDAIPGDINVERDISKAILVHLLQEKENIVDESNVSEIYTDRIAAGLELITPRVVTDEVLVNKVKPVENEIVVELDNDGKFRIAGSSTSAGIVFDGAGNASFSGKLEALEIEASTLVVDSLIVNKIKAGEIEGLVSIEGRLGELEAKIASLSATQNIHKVEIEYASDSAKATLEEAKTELQNKIMENLLTQLNSASESSTKTQDGYVDLGLDSESPSLAGNLRVKGNGLFEGILNVIDTLITNNLILNGLATFFGEVVFKDQVAFEGPVTFASDTGGNAVIEKDDIRVDVVFDQEFDYEPIVNASVAFDETKDDEGKTTPTNILEEEYFNEKYSYIIVNKSKRGFTIVLNKEAKQDVRFTWTAINIKDSKSFQSRVNK